jgi:hypothetical protein
MRKDQFSALPLAIDLVQQQSLTGAAIGAGSAFLINAASFLGVVILLYFWRRETTQSTLPAERLIGAIKTGIRYTRYSRPLTAVLVRAGAFVVGASAVPALLPLYMLVMSSALARPAMACCLASSAPAASLAVSSCHRCVVICRVIKH